MFIKQSSTHSAIITKNDTERGHELLIIFATISSKIAGQGMVPSAICISDRLEIFSQEKFSRFHVCEYLLTWTCLSSWSMVDLFSSSSSMSTSIGTDVVLTRRPLMWPCRRDSSLSILPRLANSSRFLAFRLSFLSQ